MTEMYDPAHPGEIIREAVRAKGWTVAEAADQLGVVRSTLHRVMGGHTAVTPRMALALERIGWSDAGHWVRMQGAYDLAKARRETEAA